jgi:glutamate 5-kinase
MGKTIVVKVGTSTLTGGKENLDTDYMADLVRQICQVADEGHKVVLVTSGAIRSGMAALGLKPMLSLSEKQAAAAVGQSLLMHTYRELFAATVGKWGKFCSPAKMLRTGKGSEMPAKLFTNCSVGLWCQ